MEIKGKLVFTSEVVEVGANSKQTIWVKDGNSNTVELLLFNNLKLLNGYKVGDAMKVLYNPKPYNDLEINYVNTISAWYIPDQPQPPCNQFEQKINLDSFLMKGRDGTLSECFGNGCLSVQSDGRILLDDTKITTVNDLATKQTQPRIEEPAEDLPF